MSGKIKFAKVRDVKDPNRAYQHDAGIDFFVPKFTTSFLKDLKEKNQQIFSNNNKAISISGSIIYSPSNTAMTIEPVTDSFIKFDDEKCKPFFFIPPHKRVLIPSGLHCRMEEPGRALIAANKSGRSTEDGIIFSAQVVDFTYKGEIHIGIINTSDEYIRIYEDMKVMQFIETPIFTNQVCVEPFNETFYKGVPDDRGANGFDSTANKLNS